MSVILSLFQPIADVVHWAAGPLETLVLLAAAEMPVKTDRSSSLRGSWYLSPRQHAMELVFFNVVAISLSRYFVKEALRTSPSLSAFMSRHRRPAQAWSFKWLIDRSIFMSLVVTFAATVVYKINKNAILFMLQPCHMNVMVYMYLFSPWTNSNLSKIPHLIFNIILHQSWGVLMAIAQPDLRDTTQFLEKEFFWFEHYVLLAIPAYCIWTERFHLIPLNKALAMASFFILAAYHSLLLSTVSLVTATNLNYLLAPPVGTTSP